MVVSKSENLRTRAYKTKLRQRSPTSNPSPSMYYRPPERFTFLDGDKFPGGFGTTEYPIVDYWTLRARSAQLFHQNLYARGLIRRLVTNEINTGLTPECAPDEMILGVTEESLTDWTELCENRFLLWSKNARLCDYKNQETFGSLQRTARLESLICGDVLVVLRISKSTGLPQVQLINGSAVQTPLASLKDKDIRHGVELDSKMRQVAYWVLQDDGTYKRIPAYGRTSKRRIAWLVYGTEKRLDDVRGQPLTIFSFTVVERDRSL